MMPISDYLPKAEVRRLHRGTNINMNISDFNFPKGRVYELVESYSVIFFNMVIGNPKFDLKDS
jgi:hypothetical protein